MNPMSTLPKYESDSFSRWLISATEKYFESPDVKKRFNAWKKERELNAGKADNTSA